MDRGAHNQDKGCEAGRRVMMRYPEIALKALRLAKAGGVTDAVSIIRTADWRMIRFSNNGATASKAVKGSTLYLFLVAKEGRASFTTTNFSGPSLGCLVDRALKMAKLSAPSDAYAPLPEGPFKYEKELMSIGDARLRAEKLPDAVRVATEAAISAGANRVAGSITAERATNYLCTTGGARGTYASTTYDMSVRAFADSEATGQFAQVSTSFSDLHPDEIGRRAGETARQALNPRPARPGRYDAVIGPMTVADLVEELANSASAFNVDSGLSFFVDRLGQRVSSASFSLDDDPTDVRAAGSARFDDEGLPTFRKAVIEDGILKTYLHNSLTARKMNAKSTANAGLERPRPFNLIVKAGDKSLEDLISMVDDGIFVTNNWYLRYQDKRNGDFSTILRDGLFKVENGEVVGPIRGLRLSDNMTRLFNNIKAIGRDRHWIKWWEVDVPTLAPAMLIGGANFTAPTV
jgi:PmbA protein